MIKPLHFFVSSLSASDYADLITKPFFQKAQKRADADPFPLAAMSASFSPFYRDTAFAYATPFSFLLDKNAVYLAALREDIAASEWLFLLKTLNDFLAEYDLSFDFFRNQGYLIGEKANTALALDPREFVGKPLEPRTLYQNEKAFWDKLWVECQLLLHNHPVNQARKAKGLAEIHGLWFWGGGTFGQLQSEWQCISSEDFIASLDSFIPDLLAAGKAPLLFLENIGLYEFPQKKSWFQQYCVKGK